jgi:hypothetical protein
VTRFVPRFAREPVLSVTRAALLLPKPRAQLVFICTQNARRRRWRLP